MLDVSQDHHRAKDGLKRAQKLLKQSKKRDYYKILGVKRWVQIDISIISKVATHVMVNAVMQK